jgi:hypothetical protein
MRTKTIFLLMAAALVMGFAACSKDDGNENSGKVIDLSTVKHELILQNGDVVTGKLNEDVKISIADGAKVTLRDAVILRGGMSGLWAGLTCQGNATIIIEGKDSVRGCYPKYPGIYIPKDKTLTINGTGSLFAKAGGQSGTGWGGAPGIGGQSGAYINGVYIPSGGGNIVVKGGDITAEGIEGGAGIGCGPLVNCGNITISGGTVRAIGNEEAPGIGSAYCKDCGDITISGGTVFAIAGKIIAPAIGTVRGGKCGNIMITGGIVNAVCHCHSTAAIGSGGKDSKFESITITSGITSLTAIEEIVTTLPIDQVRTTPLIGKGPEDAGSGDVNIDGKLNPDVSWMGDGMKTLKPWIVEWGELNWTIKR